MEAQETAQVSQVDEGEFIVVDASGQSRCLVAAAPELKTETREPTPLPRERGGEAGSPGRGFGLAVLGASVGVVLLYFLVRRS